MDLTATIVVLLMIFEVLGKTNQESLQQQKNRVEDIRSAMIHEYKTYIKLLQTQFLTNLPTQKVFKPFKPELINCDSTVPKVKKECLAKVQDISINNFGRGLYYTSANIKLNWWDSMKWCRSRGLVLSSIETGWKERELTELLTDNATISTNESSITLWTSGNNLEAGQFYWTNSNRSMATPSGGSKTNRCVQLTVNRASQKLSLEGVNCHLTRGFVCDVPRHCYASVCYGTSGTKRTKPKPPVTASCPKDVIPIKCEKNDELFNEDGYINEKLAKGVELRVCRKKIFIKSSLSTHVESRKICCELGMSMISMETQSKMDCLTEQLFRVYPEYRANIWVDAYTPTCISGSFIPFVWCTAKRQFSLLGVPWLAGEPFCQFGSENCARWYVTPKASGLGVQNCDALFEGGLTMCESDLPASEANITSSNEEIIQDLEQTGGKRTLPTIVQYESYTLKEINKLPKCREVKYCPMEKTNKSGLIEVKPNIGLKIEACGKTYIGSKQKIFYSKAWAFCCSLGMVMASIESTYERDCIVDGLKEDNQTARFYFVATYDETMDRNFVWCMRNSSRNNTIDDKLWCPDEPNNMKKAETVIFLTLYPAGIGCLADGPIPIPQYVLCQDPTKESIFPKDFKFSTSSSTVRPRVFSTTSTSYLFSTTTDNQYLNQTHNNLTAIKTEFEVIGSPTNSS